MDLHADHRKELTTLARLYGLRTERERVVLETVCTKFFHQVDTIRFRLEEAKRLNECAGHEFLSSFAFAAEGPGSYRIVKKGDSEKLEAIRTTPILDLLYDSTLSDEDGTYWPKLTLGDTGPEVQQLQYELFAAGYDPGKFNGHFGPDTAGAVRCLQEAEWLPRSGEVGPRDWRALHASICRKTLKS